MNPQRRPLFESALVVLIPEADGLVASFRERYTPSAAEGMPAHMDHMGSRWIKRLPFQLAR